MHEPEPAANERHPPQVPPKAFARALGLIIRSGICYLHADPSAVTAITVGFAATPPAVMATGTWHPKAIPEGTVKKMCPIALSADWRPGYTRCTGHSAKRDRDRCGVRRRADSGDRQVYDVARSGRSFRQVHQILTVASQHLHDRHILTVHFLLEYPMLTFEMVTASAALVLPLYETTTCASPNGTSAGRIALICP